MLNKAMLRDDVVSLASGTISVLTGLKNYNDIERVHADLIKFFDENYDACPEWKTWHDVWNAFRAIFVVGYLDQSKLEELD